MNAIELMHTWPGLSTASPAELLASPAWRLSADFEGGAATLRKAPEADDELSLSITLDDVPHVLGLSCSALYPDLNALWDRRSVLPEALLVALVEKECTEVLQFLENLCRQELHLKGVATEKGVAPRTTFSVTAKAGNFSFSLDLPDAVLKNWGALDNLDAANPAIATLTRETWGVYRAFEGVDAAALKEGDLLLLSGEEPAPSAPHWVTALPEDEAVRLVLAEPHTFTFADFAADALSPLPALGSAPLALAQGNRLLFAAVPAKAGEADAVLMKGL